MLAAIREYPDDWHPMAALRTAVSHLSAFDDSADATDEEALLERAIRVTARDGHRWRRLSGGCGRDTSRWRHGDDLSHAANFLYMLTGEAPDDKIARLFDVCLVLHADHGFNASTFSARVTAATLSDMYSAMASAVGTLKGGLHGGANTAVMEMLLEIGSVEAVSGWVKEALAAKKRIMGFGHRVYKTMDPRAAILKGMSEELGASADPKWFEMSATMQKVVYEQKGLWPNVDFYSASTYHTLGIPHEMFTPIFAVSRVAGWSAHVQEQLRDNRLIRPRSEYVGPRDLKYVPLAER